jgi:hypothetical protein
LTSRNLRAEFDLEDTARKERERVIEEKDKQKEAESAECARKVADDSLNRIFTGRITSYKKDDLRALAIALSISDKGTNNDLSARINNHFQANPDLQRNSRFLGLFNKPQGRSHHMVHTAQTKDSEPTKINEDDSDEESDSDGTPSPSSHPSKLQATHTVAPPQVFSSYQPPTNYIAYPPSNHMQPYLQWNGQPQAGPSTLQPYPGHHYYRY